MSTRNALRDGRHKVKTTSSIVLVDIPSVETMYTTANAAELVRIKCCNRMGYIPLFTLIISIAQVVCFYAATPSSSKALGLIVPCPPNSWYLVLTNMFAHDDNLHLWVNVASTVVLGILIETRNGFVRIAPIWYLSAFVGTAFQALISTRPIRIVGSSGGVYALLAAFASELTMNWAEIRFRWLFLMVFVIILILEITLVSFDPQPNIAYGAHFVGALYGFSIGLCLVKNWRWRRFEYIIFFAALIFAIGWFATTVALLPRIFE